MSGNLHNSCSRLSSDRPSVGREEFGFDSSFSFPPFSSDVNCYRSSLRGIRFFLFFFRSCTSFTVVVVARTQNGFFTILNPLTRNLLANDISPLSKLDKNHIFNVQLSRTIALQEICPPSPLPSAQESLDLVADPFIFFFFLHISRHRHLDHQIIKIIRNCEFITYNVWFS